LPNHADRSAVGEYTEKADPSVIAQIVRVCDDENPRKSFKLDRETQVRIYALGEGTGRSLADYGWIEDARTEVEVASGAADLAHGLRFGRGTPGTGGGVWRRGFQFVPAPHD
jgi:hypothetical protein